MQRDGVRAGGDHAGLGLRGPHGVLHHGAGVDPRRLLRAAVQGARGLRRRARRLWRARRGGRVRGPADGLLRQRLCVGVAGEAGGVLRQGRPGLDPGELAVIITRSLHQGSAYCRGACISALLLQHRTRGPGPPTEAECTRISSVLLRACEYSRSGTPVARSSLKLTNYKIQS